MEEVLAFKFIEDAADFRGYELRVAVRDSVACLAAFGHGVCMFAVGPCPIVYLLKDCFMRCAEAVFVDGSVRRLVLQNKQGECRHAGFGSPELVFIAKIKLIS